jgi:hypothetical protein
MMLIKLIKNKRYRVEVAVGLFNCVTDIENYSLKLWECVMKSALAGVCDVDSLSRHVADVDERQEICSRLGWMLVFNPLEVCVMLRLCIWPVSLTLCLAARWFLPL